MTQTLNQLSRPERVAIIFQLCFPDKVPTNWQLDDICSAIQHQVAKHDPSGFAYLQDEKEIVWVRSRGGSKTQDGVVLAIYWCLFVGDGGWYSPDASQLDRVRKVMRECVFFDYGQNVTNDHAVCINGSCILFGILGGRRNVRGPRNEWIIIDEEEQINDVKTEVGYDGVIGTLAASRYGHVVHMGTGIRGSKLDENVNEKHLPTFTRIWLDCPWLVAAGKIQAEYDAGVQPKWWLENEYEGKFNTPGGSVFTQILFAETFPDMKMLKQGIDFNTIPGNTGVRIGVVDQKIYLLEEQTFQYRRDDELLQSWALAYPTEAESGGWNMSFAPRLKGVTWAPFSEVARTQSTTNSDNNKSDRLHAILQYEIVVNQSRTPEILKELLRCTWTQTLTGKPTVDTAEYHHIAALLHAIYAGTINVHMIENRPNPAFRGDAEENEI